MERNAQGMQQISYYTAHSCAHMGYIGSVVPLPSRPAALGTKSLFYSIYVRNLESWRILTSHLFR